MDGKAVRPNLFIVGAAKSGTTAMNDYLKLHPEIFISERKEVHYFGRELFSVPNKRTLDLYLSNFASATYEKVVGESSVWYLYSERAAAEIKEFNPDSKIIIMLRNPVDFLHSLHSQMLYTGDEDIVDFQEALEAEEDRKQGLRIPRDTKRISVLYYRETAKFTRQVQRYFETFGRENVHIIIFDDFVNDTAKVYQDTLRFLGVNPDFQPKFSIVNPNKVVRSKTVRSVLSRKPSTIKTLGRVLVPSGRVRRRLIDGLKNWNVSYQRRAPMDPELRARLTAELVPEVDRLSGLLGRDLSSWYVDSKENELLEEPQAQESF